MKRTLKKCLNCYIILKYTYLKECSIRNEFFVVVQHYSKLRVHPYIIICLTKSSQGHKDYYTNFFFIKQYN